MSNDTQDNWKDRFSEEVTGEEAAPSTAEAHHATEESKNDAAPGADGQGADIPPMPVPTFSTFVLSLASSALVQLGEVPDPTTGEVREDPILAKHTIDVLTMLQEKIAKGLDEDESRLFDGLLYELRMKFVMKK